MLTRLVIVGRRAAPLAASLAVLVAALPALGAIQAEEPAALAAADGHLVISELQTGGTGASDEFVELYNPTDAALPLEGLELVYVTASGGTLTRKASWALGAPSVVAGAHVLVSNEAGIYAAVGDLTYASGVAATGGAWALRIQGASTALDSVGWGTAVAWLEGRATPAPAAGSSLERLPGGSAGSTQDADDNLVDFAVRSIPEPQNQGSPVVPGAGSSPPVTTSPTPTLAPTATPLASATPTATGTPTATPSSSPTPTLAPTPEPSAAPITIAAARALPDGSEARIRGIALTGSDFGDGGGYVADATGGIAVLVTGATFERGQVVEVAGELDDRYAQRTLRADGVDVAVVGSGAEPAAQPVASGAVDESVEGQLVELDGTVAGGPSPLSGGQAFDVDDGSGRIRVFVADATAIDVTAWGDGVRLRLRGVVGQRDSSGSGTAGYRVQPRDAGDILAVDTPVPGTPSPSATPLASPTPSGPPSPVASPSPSVDSLPLVPISDARAAAAGTRLRLRGVVTLPSDLVEPGSAIVQDASGAILLRLDDEAGSVVLGELIEVAGTRSTKAGMLTLRITDPVRRLGSQAEPTGVRLATGAASDAHEAELVIVRGAVTGHLSRSSAGGLSFEIDDGSGPLRVAFSGRAALGDAPATGSWIEVRGPLGQETTGAQPQRGYRVWPRRASDVILVASAGVSTTATTDAGESGDPGGGFPAGGGSSASAARPPRLGEPAASPTTNGSAPGFGPRSRGDTGAAGAAISPTSTSLAPRQPTSLAAGLLLVGLGGLLASATAAWRGGAINRLWPRSGSRPDGDDGPDERPDPDEEAPLTRLSLVGGAGPEPG
ncbi:MAG: hypothetical protein ABI622_02020 [Chloroflexota bacterium]